MPRIPVRPGSCPSPAVLADIHPRNGQICRNWDSPTSLNAIEPCEHFGRSEGQFRGTTLGAIWKSAESGSFRTRFWSDACPNGPRQRSGGEDLGRHDVDRGAHIPVRDRSAGPAAVRLRAARMVSDAAPMAILRRALRVHFHELSTGRCCLVLELCPQKQAVPCCKLSVWCGLGLDRRAGFSAVLLADHVMSRVFSWLTAMNPCLRPTSVVAR